MAALEILKMGHPLLRQHAVEIYLEGLDVEERNNLTILVDQMVETMKAASGTGLAAPQVGFMDQVVVYFLTKGRGEMPATEDQPLTVLINPKIKPIGTDKFYDWEACLSVPGLRGLVPRYQQIELSYQTVDNHAHTVHLKGFHARVVQHECDHLQGIL